MFLRSQSLSVTQEKLLHLLKRLCEQPIAHVFNNAILQLDNATQKQMQKSTSSITCISLSAFTQLCRNSNKLILRSVVRSIS